MKKNRSTKRALLMSALSMVLCLSMLVGSTFAWFTDSVTSSGNIIKSGTLDVEMEWKDATATGAQQTYKDASEGAIFNYALWEPGYVDAKYIQIKNVGTLAFNYQLHIIPSVLPAAGAVNLADVIDVYFAESDVVVDRTLAGLTKVGTLSQLMADTDGAAYGVLYAAGDAAGVSEKTVTIALKMQETAGNEYQNLSVGDGFKVQLIASQLAYESDSFGSDYDNGAAWPVVAKGSTPVNATGSTTIYVKDEKRPSTTIATVIVPEAAVDDETTTLDVTVVETVNPDGFTVASEKASATYDVTVTGLKDGNTTDVTVQLFVGKNLSGVELYHKGILMDPAKYVYTPADGIITFVSATFSPFTVVYDAVSVEGPSTPTPDEWNPDSIPEGMPAAIVTDVSDSLAEKTLAWKPFGSIPAANANQQLAVVYKYETSAGAYDAKYDEWYCDFYVSVNRAIEADQLFLGGEYGNYGWVGFNAPAVEANTEYALLASAVAGDLVTHGNGSDTGWTYASVKAFVGQFHCGVAKAIAATDDLSELIFTVKLCLTNPENPDEYYNVKTITYEFPTVVYSLEDFRAALDSGKTHVVLGSDIDLSQGLVIGG